MLCHRMTDAITFSWIVAPHAPKLGSYSKRVEIAMLIFSMINFQALKERFGDNLRLIEIKFLKKEPTTVCFGHWGDTISF